jgi:hypothetical protein
MNTVGAGMVTHAQQYTSLPDMLNMPQYFTFAPPYHGLDERGQLGNNA